ncbi:hypothetical protein JZK55_00740 [Dissulfurispira thermophila]|uniref:Glycerophosphoryl diester phosphodiesterase membrane domain-containing protein n=1 Tax=Dissulfurispira thermophila TaxID=2715679 RepID=A0A7G1GYL4_9BACT|nr:hypothetical protein JZK55_00740 [Dissulfurispira thermophila]
MSYIATIKEGIQTVHKNYQLVIIQFASMLLSCIGFFTIVGIPIAIAFIMFGLDLTEILRIKDIVSAFKGSAELLNKYFAMAIVIILTLLIYVAFIIALWIFTISGTIGVLRDSIIDADFKFKLKTFLREGRNFFSPVFFFSAMIGIAFIFLAFMLGLLGGGTSAIIEMAKAQEATLALFLGVFFSLIILSVGIFLIIVTLSITTYGIAHLSFQRSNTIETIKNTVRYIYSRPSSMGFYAILLIGYMVVGFLVILIGSPFTLIPIIGPILSLPYQLVTYVIQGYVSLVMLSSIFHYYYKTWYSLSSSESSEDADTSLITEEGQAFAHEEKDETQ